MKDLSEIREEIDKIDRQIVALYEARMKLTTEVAEYKISTGKPVLDKIREQEKLTKIKELVHTEENRYDFSAFILCFERYSCRLCLSSGSSFIRHLHAMIDRISNQMHQWI